MGKGATFLDQKDAARRYPMASVKLPTPDELRAVGRQLGMSLSDADVAFFLETMGGTVAAYHAIEAMADPMPRVKYPRTPGHRPEGAENKYNAWYYKRARPPASCAASASR
jgi:amidase